MEAIEVKAFFSEVYEQVHHQHHITTSYAQHKALGEFYEKWDELTDDFIETYQGKYGRIEGSYTTTVMNSLTPDTFLGLVSAKLYADIVPFVPSQDIDLANIVADMIGLTSHTIYLLSLK